MRKLPKTFLKMKLMGTSLEILKGKRKI
jgi:hypothetical protein